jgi:hypothetical protein
MPRRKRNNTPTNLIIQYNPWDCRSYVDGDAQVNNLISSVNNSNADMPIMTNVGTAGSGGPAFTFGLGKEIELPVITGYTGGNFQIKIWVNTQLETTNRIILNRGSVTANQNGIRVQRPANQNNLQLQMSTPSGTVSVLVSNCFLGFNNTWVEFDLIWRFNINQFTVYRNKSFFSSGAITNAQIPNLNGIEIGNQTGLGNDGILNVGPFYFYNLDVSNAISLLSDNNTYRVRDLDNDVKAFIGAGVANISNPTIINALNQLVLDLKKTFIWNKMLAIFPFVGGNATAHLRNLRQPALFSITWTGGVIHDSNGVTFNGINGRGNFNRNVFGTMGANNASFGLYSRTSGTTNANSFDMGCNLSSLTSRFLLKIREVGDVSNVQLNDETGSSITTTVVDGSGLHIASRTSSTFLYRGWNGQTIATSTISNSGTHPNNSMFIGARNNAGVADGFTDRNIAFAFYGNGLTETDNEILYKIVQKFQTLLGRQVGTPFL